jgi:hypothetical protein
MTAAGKGASGSYARAVERLWAGLCGRAVILSPKDWSIVEEWYARGIPLQVVEEAIDAAAERRKRGKESPPPRGLAYIAPAVEEGWTAVLEGRRQGPSAAASEQKQKRPEISGWRERSNAEAEGSALRLLLTELIAAFEGGAEAAELDRLLDARLPAAAPEELLSAIETEVTRELAPYSERMTSSAYEATLRRAVSARLRQMLRLDRLSAP